MVRTFAVAASAAALLLLSPGAADAKDLSGRVGIGYVNNLPATGGAISARYWLNDAIGIQGDLGISFVDPDQGDSENNFGIGLGGQYAFVHEPNLHVYGAAGLSFGSVAVTGVGPGGAPASDSETAIGVTLGMGTEWFFVGTPNLGFTTQFGLTFVSISDVANTITLSGGEFAQFGIRYYFGGPKGPGQ